jgi:diadenosine tetraphosphate (Ap4A) HIT family hydrolase
LHVHVVGRFANDPYWPGVVWGNDQKQKYTNKQIDNIREKYNRLKQPDHIPYLSR